jgi:hypothetical protein
MTYFIIRSIGDLPVIDSVENYSYTTVFEKDGKFFVKETYQDIDWETHEIDVQVYPSKKEAWKVALGRLDEHIAHMQKIREEAFHKALDDGAFVKTPEEFNKWMDSIKGEPSNNLFESRNKVK